MDTKRAFAKINSEKSARKFVGWLMLGLGMYLLYDACAIYTFVKYKISLPLISKDTFTTLDFRNGYPVQFYFDLGYGLASPFLAILWFKRTKK